MTAGPVAAASKRRVARCGAVRERGLAGRHRGPQVGCAGGEDLVVRVAVEVREVHAWYVL